MAGDVVELSAEASAADWHARPGADGSENPGWQLYALRPRELEFWQARHDRRHIRHRYGPLATWSRGQAQLAGINPTAPLGWAP